MRPTRLKRRPKLSLVVENSWTSVHLFSSLDYSEYLVLVTGTVLSRVSFASLVFILRIPEYE